MDQLAGFGLSLVGAVLAGLRRVATHAAAAAAAASQLEFSAHSPANCQMATAIDPSINQKLAESAPNLPPSPSPNETEAGAC